MGLIDMKSTLENIYQLKDKVDSKNDIELIKRMSYNEPTSFLEGAYYGIELAMRTVAHQPIMRYIVGCNNCIDEMLEDITDV